MYIFIKNVKKYANASSNLCVVKDFENECSKK